MTPKDVTLLMVDGGNNVPQSVKTINHCASMLPWGAVRLFACEKIECPVNAETFLIPRLQFPIGSTNFMGALGPCLFETEFMLYIQSDGYIINPHLWNDAWLQWDYVAAPWPAGFMKSVMPNNPELHKATLGCGGFVLRSYRMAKVTSDIITADGGANTGLDHLECVQQRAKIEAKGIRFAPVDVAMRFAFEYDMEDYPGWTDAQSFGFHKLCREGRKLL